MKEIHKALVHKYGPLKLWAWLGIGAAGLLAYRRKQAGQSVLPMSLSSGAGGGGGAGDTGLGSNQYSPNTPPDLYYEPGGSLPVVVGGGTNSTGGSGIGGLLGILEKLINQRDRNPKHRHHKHHHKHVVKHHKPGDKHRPRSHAHVHHPHTRTRTGGASAGHSKAAPSESVGSHGKATPSLSATRKTGKVAVPRHVRPTAKGATRTRSTLKAPVVRHTQIQRPATGVRPSHHPAPHPAPRPSAPKQRTMRAPHAKPAAKRPAAPHPKAVAKAGRRKK